MKRAFKSLINWRVDLLFTPGLEHFDHDVGEGMAETLKPSVPPGYPGVFEAFFHFHSVTNE